MRWGIAYTRESAEGGVRTAVMRPYGHPLLLSMDKASILAKKISGKIVPSIAALRLVKQAVEFYSGKLIIQDGQYIENPRLPRQVVRFRNFKHLHARGGYLSLCQACINKRPGAAAKLSELFSKLEPKPCCCCGLRPSLTHYSYEDLLPYLPIDTIGGHHP